MAEITSQLVKEFVNNQLIPVAQTLQQVAIKLNDAKQDWTSFVQAEFAAFADEDTVVVSRGSIPDPTKAEMASFLVFINSLLGELEATGVPAAINKLCINPVG